MPDNHRELAQNVTDIAAGSAALAAYLSYLPEVAVVLTIIWTLIRIYEWARVRIFHRPTDAGTKA